MGRMILIMFFKSLALPRKTKKPEKRGYFLSCTGTARTWSRHLFVSFKPSRVSSRIPFDALGRRSISLRQRNQSDRAEIILTPLRAATHSLRIAGRNGEETRHKSHSQTMNVASHRLSSFRAQLWYQIAVARLLACWRPSPLPSR